MKIVFPTIGVFYFLSLNARMQVNTVLPASVLGGKCGSGGRGRGEAGADPGIFITSKFITIDKISWQTLATGLSCC